MGAETTQDDVMIMADPYDTTDYNQDGYFIYGAERFYYNQSMYDFFAEEGNEDYELNVMHFLYQQSLNNKNKADLIYTHEVCFWFAILLFSFPFQQIKIPHFYGIF